MLTLRTPSRSASNTDTVVLPLPRSPLRTTVLGSVIEQPYRPDAIALTGSCGARCGLSRPARWIDGDAAHVWRRIALLSATGNVTRHRSGTQSGSPDALLRRGPLRTVRATRRGTRLKQAAGAISGVQRCWFLLSVGGSAEAGGVNESGLVR